MSGDDQFDLTPKGAKAVVRIKATLAVLGGVGDRVKLVATTDPYTRQRPGDTGTIRTVDGMGTRHVDWDNGSSLGLIPGEDKWEVANLS